MTTETSSDASPATGCDGPRRSTNLAPRRAAVIRRGELAFDDRVIFDDGLPETVVVLEGASENSNRVGALEGSSEDSVQVEVDR